MRGLWKHYYAGTDALIWVIDSADKDKVDESFDWLKKVHSFLSAVLSYPLSSPLLSSPNGSPPFSCPSSNSSLVLNDEEMANVIVLVLANKQDLPGALGLVIISPSLQGGDEEGR